MINTVDFGDTSVSFKALQSGSTDFDLTGQIVWPASMLLSQYLQRHSQDFKGLSVLEVGSGIGVSGIMVAKYADTKRVVLSDYSQIVVDVLEDNVKMNFKEGERPICDILNWGHGLDEFLNKFGAFDCIIGADVVYWPDACQPLFETVAHVLSHKPNAYFLLSYISRSIAMDKKLEKIYTSFGFQAEKIDLEKEGLNNYKDAMLVKLRRQQ